MNRAAVLSQTCIGVYDGLCAAAHTLQHPFPLCANKTDKSRNASTSEEKMTAVQKQLNKDIIIINNNNDDVFLEHQLALLFHLDDEPSAYNVFMQ